MHIILIQKLGKAIQTDDFSEVVDIFAHEKFDVNVLV